MSNPYESPAKSAQAAKPSPYWYVFYYEHYRQAWWIGNALIAASWLDIASPTAGWVGLGLAGTSALGSHVLPALAGVKPEDYVMLDSRLLESKGRTYSDAIDRFLDGATLVCDGVAFGFRLDKELACALVAQSPNISETEARDDADHAQKVFDTLIQSSPEFAAAVAGQIVRISILSHMAANPDELFRVIDGNIESRVSCRMNN